MPEESIDVEKHAKNQEGYMTLFEGLLRGGSDSATVNGKEIFVDIPNLLSLMRDSETRKAILTPPYIAERKATLEEVSRIREQMEFSSTLITIFESMPLRKYFNQGIELSFKPGKLDDNVQLAEFNLYLSKNGQKIGLSQVAPEDLVISEDFKHVVSFLGRKDNALKFKIKSEKEIKSETAQKPQ